MAYDGRALARAGQILHDRAQAHENELNARLRLKPRVDAKFAVPERHSSAQRFRRGIPRDPIRGRVKFLTEAGRRRKKQRANHAYA